MTFVLYFFISTFFKPNTHYLYSSLITLPDLSGEYQKEFFLKIEQL